MKKAFITLVALTSIAATASANDAIVNSDAVGQLICGTLADNVAYLEEIRVNNGGSLEEVYKEFYPEQDTEFWDDAYKFLRDAPKEFKELHYDNMGSVFYDACLNSLKK